MSRTPEPTRDVEAADQGAPNLGEYVAVFRRRKLIVASLTGLVVASALLFSFLQTPLYGSEVRVLVKPATILPTIGLGVAPNLETEKELATSIPVAELAAERLGGAPDPQNLLQGLSASAATEAEVLLLSYVHPDPVEAQRRAQAFADAYLQFRREQAVDDLLSGTESLQTRMEQLQGELRRVNEGIAQAATQEEQLTLQSRADTLESQIALLQERIFQATPPENLRVGQILEPAAVPSSPVSPNYVTNVGMALVIGLGLGIGVAFIRDRLDDSLRGRRDLEAGVGAPVLAVIPHASSWRKKRQEHLVSKEQPTSAAAEAYRTLRTALMYSASQRRVKTVLVTSPHPGEGKTTTVANLAVSLAQTGKLVVAVSADLRKPRLHRFFAAENRVGLTDVLTEGVPVWEALGNPGGGSLMLLTSGPIPGNPSELLGSDSMRQMLNELGDGVDFVILDSAPVLGVADALTMAPLVDAVLLVADAQRTSRGAVRQARQHLDQVEAAVAGGIFNNFDPSKPRAYPDREYYYTYKYETVSSNGGAGPTISGEKHSKMWST
jgi:succinoglycan biosynthesis transport protein ExoP